MRSTALALLSVLAISSTAACTAASDDADSGEDAITRPKLTARFADMKKIQTTDLARMAVNMGAEKLNGALSIRSKYVDLGIDIKPTYVFGAQAEDNGLVPDDGKVKSLADIRQGLASDLGEREFPTELAKVRLDHLAQGDDNYYVETGFGVKGALGFSVSHPAGGFGSVGSLSVNVGFKKGEDLETRLVVASPSSSLKDLMELNGEAVKALRGFVVPEKIEDIKAMKPGEMIGLKGKGTLAAHFGLGVPILIANAGPFAYTLAVSAGLAHTAQGILDVAMVRLDGDEVAVDVGIGDAQLDAESVGISGGFGVNATCEDGQPCLDSALGKIVKNGLVKQLNNFLRTSISAGSSQGDNRLELARMRFHLSQPEVPDALEQALHGDLRYAQALYARNLDSATPPVKFDFDMMRAATTSARTFGAEIFGIDIYRRRTAETKGAFAVQTPNGVQSVIWDSFEKSSGLFQMDSGSKLTTLSSAEVNAANPDKANNNANLIVQTVVGDKRMDDDVMLDSADGLIVMLAGPDAVQPLDKYADAMQGAITRECPLPDANSNDDSNRPQWDQKCNVDLIEDDSRKVVSIDGRSLSLVEARAEAVDAFKQLARVKAVPSSYQTLLSSAAELRLTLAMVKIRSVDDIDAPRVSFALNYRLDDKALGHLASVKPETYAEGVRSYLRAVSVKRVGFDSHKPPKDAQIDAAATAMSALLTSFQQRYQALAANESQDLPSVLSGKSYVRLPIGIRFEVSDVADANGPERMAQFMDDEKRIRVESISQQRAIVAKDLFDALVAAANDKVDFGNTKNRLFKEQAAAYPLLAAVPLANLEVGIDVGADVSSNFWHKRERFAKAGFQAVTETARGSDVEAIAGNMFDMNAMMNFGQ